MNCHICSNKLPTDSEFCQYCGARIEQRDYTNTVIEAEQDDIKTEEQNILSFPEYNVENVDNKKVKKVSKKKYCRICGGVIETETKKCLGCGKQYFRGIRLKTFLNFVFGATMLVSLFFNIMQYISYVDIVDKKSSVVSEKQGLEVEIEKLKKNISDEYDKGYNAGYSSGYSIGKSQSTVVTKPKTTYSFNTVEDDECCIIPGCNRSPQRNSFYCFSHECMDVGCHNKRANDFCSYCTNHKCAVSDCNSAQAFNSLYCYRHKN